MENNEPYIGIPQMRYEQLIKAEQDAKLLKAILADAYEEYHALDRGVLTTLYTMFIGKKEEDHV